MIFIRKASWNYARIRGDFIVVVLHFEWASIIQEQEEAQSPTGNQPPSRWPTLKLHALPQLHLNHICTVSYIAPKSLQDLGSFHLTYN